MPEIILPYRPRQVFLPYHNRTQRWAVIVAHRRCGKTVACVNDLIRRAIINPRPHARYAYVAPFLSQGKEIAWEYIKRYAAPLITGVNETELRCTLRNGADIRIHGADNPDRLRGSYVDGITLDEYAQMRPSVWSEVIRPMLADREGWASFIGTPKGHNAFYEVMYGGDTSPSGKTGAVNNPQWFSATYRADETNILPDHELADMRQTMTEEAYEQEALCSFEAAIQGAYFGKEMAQAEREGRIRAVPYERSLPVHTAWDLGIGDATSIWMWQVYGNEIRIIDHYENHGQGLQHYCEVLERRGYEYGDDWVPHDARVRELGTGRTRVETLAEMRRKPRLVPHHRPMDGIQAVRLSLGQCYFDVERCRDGIEALKQYHAEYDEKLGTFKDTPKHDWTSHAADAFRYLCMAWREIGTTHTHQDPLQELLRKKTINDWLRDHDNDRDDN